MVYISSVIIYEDKHEADVSANGESFHITTADLLSLDIEEGEQYDNEILDRLVYCDCRLSCIKKAFSVLAYGDVSVRRLRMKLSEKFDKDLSEEVALLMKERGYIDEYAASERFASRTADTKLWGPERIRSELIQRGYERDAVNSAVSSLDEDEIFENLLSLIQKKMPASGIDDIKIKSKLCAYLQRMGYTYGMINSALRAFGEQDGYFGD